MNESKESQVMLKAIFALCQICEQESNKGMKPGCCLLLFMEEEGRRETENPHFGRIQC